MGIACCRCRDAVDVVVVVGFVLLCDGEGKRVC